MGTRNDGETSKHPLQSMLSRTGTVHFPSDGAKNPILFRKRATAMQADQIKELQVIKVCQKITMFKTMLNQNLECEAENYPQLLMIYM